MLNERHFQFVSVGMTMLQGGYRIARLCNHLEEEEKAGGLAFIVLQMYSYYNFSVALPSQGAVFGLQCVIVIFPDHTHLLLIICGKQQTVSYIGL